MTDPWILSGDFNVVKDSTEKWSEHQHGVPVSSELVDAMRACDIMDHQYIGPVYTWSNSHMYCKLDRVMINHRWLNMAQGSMVHFYPPGISDHSYSIVRVFKENKAKGFPFKFKNVWASDAHFLQIVASVW